MNAHKRAFRARFSFRRIGGRLLAAALLVGGILIGTPDGVVAQDDPETRFAETIRTAAGEAFGDGAAADAVAAAAEGVSATHEGAWAVVGDLRGKLAVDELQALTAALQPQAGPPPRGMRGMRNGPPPMRGVQGPGMRGGPGAGWADSLDLSDEQRQEVKALRAEHQRRMQEMRRRFDRPPTAEQRREAAARRAEMRAEMRSVLTEEQWAELAALRAERRASRRYARRSSRNEALALTDKQIAAFAQAEAKIRADAGDPPLRFIQPGTRHTEMRSAVADVLTDEQLALMDLHHALIMSIRQNDNGAGGRGMQRRGGRQNR
jgi:Spy/CpxP family protein refolding chaperone